MESSESNFRNRSSPKTSPGDLLNAKKIQTTVRILLGALFLFGGIAFFFTTPPTLPPGNMATYMAGLVASKYFFYLLKITEIICGAFLVTGFFVPLALVVLAPIAINIFFVHLMLLGPDTLVTPVLICTALTYLSFFFSELQFDDQKTIRR